MTTLSIIVPVHNTEKWLPELLKSIKEQKTDYEFECIFIFDNCTDDSKAIVEQSGLCDINITCAVNSCGLARNRGLDMASGRYIWFLDSDDYLTTDTAIQEALDFVQGKRIVKIPFESDNFNSSCYAMVWQYIFERELIGKQRFRKEQPAEDNAFMDELFKRVRPETIETYDFPLYFYRYLREGSNMERVSRGEKI